MPKFARREGLLIGLYALVLAFNLYHHEMWRDEFEVWGISASSSTPADVYRNRAETGHPPLWYLLSWLMVQVIPSPVALQVLNFIFGIATAFVVVRYGPFRYYQKFLLLFSYFLLYEYATLSRNYLPGVLSLFVICALWKRFEQNLMGIALGLAFLMQNNLYAALLAAAIGAAATWRVARDWYRFRFRFRQLGGAVGILLAGTLLMVSTGWPSPNSAMATGWNFVWNRHHLREIGLAVLTALCPIPGNNTTFWLPFVADWVIGVPVGLFVLLGLAFTLRKTPVALGTVFLTIALVMLAMYVKYFGFIRHHGHVALAVMAGGWLLHYESPRLARQLRWQIVLGTFLVVGCIGGLKASWIDYRLPFSNSAAVARFIRSHYPPDVPVAVHYPFAGVSIAGALRREVLMINSNRQANFSIFDRVHAIYAPDSVVTTNLYRFAARYPAGALLVFNHLDYPGRTLRQQLPTFQQTLHLPIRRAGMNRYLQIKHVADFTGAILPDENYSTYECLVVADSNRVPNQSETVAPAD